METQLNGMWQLGFLAHQVKYKLNNPLVQELARENTSGCGKDVINV